MKMNGFFAVVACAGFASMAQAQNVVVFDLQVSLDGSNWGDSVTVNTYSPTTVFGRLVLRGSQAGSTNIVGLPGGTVASFPVSNTLSSDGTSNLAGKFSNTSPASNIALRGAGTAGAAIDRSTLTQNITLQNLPVGSGGQAGNDVVFMTFGFDLGTSAADRTLVLSTGTRTNVAIYTTPGGSSSSASSTSDNASIIVTPAPGVMALVGLGGLVAGRRRRA